MEFTDFYRNHRILITGHTGFKGGWLTVWLKLLGAKVCGISLPPETVPNFFELSHVDRGMESHFSDITDAVALKKIVQKFEPETVIHMAAQPFVRRSYDQPLKTFNTNVMGTINLLEALRVTPSTRNVVVVTSDKVYENRNTGEAFKETDRMGGDDPYSSSKTCTEHVVNCWRMSFFNTPMNLRIASVRAGNVFGGGDWGEDRLVPDIVRAIAANQSISLRNPTHVRPWQHVLDVSAGYLSLIIKLAKRKERFDEAWNFGPKIPNFSDVETFTNMFLKVWEAGSIEYLTELSAPKEAALLQLNSSKSVERLGWHPVLSLKESIEWTVKWYDTVQQDNLSAEQISVDQLKEYGTKITNVEFGETEKNK